jgi:hypothetical protein
MVRLNSDLNLTNNHWLDSKKSFHGIPSGTKQRAILSSIDEDNPGDLARLLYKGTCGTHEPGNLLKSGFMARLERFGCRNHIMECP